MTFASFILDSKIRGRWLKLCVLRHWMTVTGIEIWGLMILIRYSNVCLSITNTFEASGC
jgi:hypothetical protein